MHRSDEGDASTCPVCSQHVEPDFAQCPWCGVRLRPVLVVADPDPSVPAAIVSLVDGEYEVRGAGTGQEAIEAVRSGRADALLLDPALPNADAAKVVREPRSTSDHIPVVCSAPPRRSLGARAAAHRH